LDGRGRQFLESHDWGEGEVERLVTQFSLMYMMKHMGLPGPAASPDQVRHRCRGGQEEEGEAELSRGGLRMAVVGAKQKSWAV
jgi:hypothetical protein